MTWRLEDTAEGQDLVYDGVESGVAPSPLKGTANIQNANISTEMGEVLASFGRTAQQQAAITGGTLTPDGTTLFDAPANLKGGQWIKVTASTVSSITAATDPTTLAIDYLLVGGGGAAGGVDTTHAAGGGGGGEVEEDTAAIAVGSYAVTVGAGGVGNTFSGASGAGQSTVLATVDTAIGGGAGGGTAAPNGGTGASGGGGAGASSAGTAGTGTAGSNGGAGNTTTTRSGGGGGGAGGVPPTPATSSNGGNGGIGVASSITGSAVNYGGGGGGGRVGGSGGIATGDAGGGSGNLYGSGAGSAGTANRGGGGGGGGGTLHTGANGGSGIAVVRYLTGTAFCTGGNQVYQSGNYTVHVFTSDGVLEVHWINPGGLYFVSYASGGKIKLSDHYDPLGASPLTHGSTGSVTFSTVAVPNQAIAKATENYNTATTTEYRYYILDRNGYVWCFDTKAYVTSGFTWMLTNPADYSDLNIGGIAVLNGWLMAVATGFLLGKPTVNLGGFFGQVTDGYLTNPFSTHRNSALVGSQGKLYYTDNQFLGELFPTTSLVTSQANIQSYCQYTATTTVGSISALINGSTPYLTSGTRVPVVFFTDSEGTLPTAISSTVIYYLQYSPGPQTFTVYSSTSSTTALDIATGAAGNQYFNTFFPQGPQKNTAGTSTPLFQFQPQRINLPFYEQATSLVEVGNLILIGCEGTAVYPWNQIDATPSDVIQLPEAGVQTMVNVNNMAYLFAGNRGNVYISNGSVASLVLKVPDYCAGVPGTPSSYIEPYFTWGDAMYCRGRVYFSILDQTAVKAGNAGGVWSFIPTGNMTTNDPGLALRLENQNSYGDYDGYATILIPSAEQDAIAPQYWAAWQDSYDIATAAFGIDFTATTPVTTFVVETDLLVTGSLLAKTTFGQLEYKLTAPAVAGDSVQLFYRLNSNAAWTSCGTAEVETEEPISGYYAVNFEKTQWLQFRAVCSTGGTTASSFTRLAQLRLR